MCVYTTTVTRVRMETFEYVLFFYIKILKIYRYGTTSIMYVT